ncbi:RdgB/HAM1 family non-canonical purine NTP pyrophosphatase [Candidatus Aminicenantes bacterium AC-708-M15]|jgi:XTP/dITP diphosphohydrolase|nr:RdgB/HAM1 family non-canonical purine NTP pyrophosphatase [SCandidatus Aminicenantes bacterium Aminicenantia_JdfR_composite]MCP2597017.1 RdgB/HAM1 family non-canonical purine NTP pyrophosphatase [Candidatus Aminicenantes bacterium AC-335-G13]MCP2604476.1 RdgB/HAM1 family non-canonical purine NTP pyrophosphatase [Candidatus Aminicenantes bacterium AC-708-M15]MCP2619370.1 RdgB/HAM1 family non-canonical purine NTP pyrophosphatase [Candidatus Aminicenantes bacterium AC-335-K20]
MVKKKLLIATTNQGKIKEIKKSLEHLSLEISDLKENRIELKYEEKGKTFLENARGKAIFYSQFFKGLVLGEDSGLEVEKLGGAPGVYSARFAGANANDELNNKKLLALLEGVPWEERKARFISAQVVVEDGKVIFETIESVSGYILEEPRGNYGFGYDPVFYYPPLKKSFAELLPEEKNKVSHRGKALNRLKEFLEKYLK